MYVIFVLACHRSRCISLWSATLAPFAYLYPGHLAAREPPSKRQSRFEKEFPFFLDVLVLGMKAGLTFTAAVEQAVEQLARRSGAPGILALSARDAHRCRTTRRARSTLRRAS